MKKVLYVASKVKLHINLFHTPVFMKLKEEGCEVHVCAANDYGNKEDCIIPGCDKYFDVPFYRLPFHPRNIKAYYRLKKIINENNYDIIHCHTPIGGVLTRLAARKARKNGCKVIYTAHGFHFYEGASQLNWLLYYNAEKFLSRYTDLIITINEEDYKRACNFKKAKVEKLDGVGIDIARFKGKTEADRNAVKKELSIPDESILLIFAGEMSYRKHQDFLIDAVSDFGQDSKIHLLLAGEGDYLEHYKEYSREKGIEDRIHFLGFRTDIDKLMSGADIYVSSSRQEGLPVNIIEAMAMGLPIVCFDIRGNNDLIRDGENGYLVKKDDMNQFCQCIKKLTDDDKVRNRMSLNNILKASSYDQKHIVEKVIEIYREASK